MELQYKIYFVELELLVHIQLSRPKPYGSPYLDCTVDSALDFLDLKSEFSPVMITMAAFLLSD